MSLNQLEERLRQIPADREIDFLLEFMFELTIVLRGAPIFPRWRLGRRARMSVSMLNEIHHRILNRIRDLRNGENWSSPNYVPEMVVYHVRQAPNLIGYIGAALERALAKHDAEPSNGR